MNRSIVAFSDNSDESKALDECIAKIREENTEPKLLIYFSAAEPFIYFSDSLKKAFPGATTIGSMSYLSFSSEGQSKKGLSVMAIFSGIEISSGIIFEIARHPRNYITHIRKALSEISSYENTICLEFMSAGSKGEELVLDTFNHEFHDKGISVVGGTGYANPKTKETFVSLNGISYTNTCVFVLIHNQNGKIYSYRENIYKETGIEFLATDVDCENRIVYEYNDEPAADTISKAMGVTKLELKNMLIQHPMGRIIDGKLFIAAPHKIFEDDSISYFARIYNCTKMLLLEPDDFEKVWENTKKRVSNEIQKPSFTLAINCTLRTKLFDLKDKNDDFIEQLKNNYGTFLGFSGYGEQMDYIHLNQTLVLLIFE
ncbi:MAG: hypothetical protein K5829_11005 [Treponema sp.]|nr:hypothetical protein [Treponema sp.]